jgi:hypothetical protein
MGYRELFVVEIVEILRLWQRGHGYRTVAERTSADRKTVRRYVEAAQALGLSRDEESVELDDVLLAGVATAVKPGAPVSSGEMRSHCRQHASLLESWLGDGRKGPKLVKLLARHSGVVVPLRTLQRFVNEELGRDGPRRDTVRLAPPPAGQMLEIDFLELGWFVERGTGRKRPGRCAPHPAREALKSPPGQRDAGQAVAKLARSRPARGSGTSGPNPRQGPRASSRVPGSSLLPHHGGSSAGHR